MRLYACMILKNSFSMYFTYTQFILRTRDSATARFVAFADSTRISLI